MKWFHFPPRMLWNRFVMAWSAVNAVCTSLEYWFVAMRFSVENRLASATLVYISKTVLPASTGCRTISKKESCKALGKPSYTP